ncbi:protein FAR1-RELATED SEQUENCE 5-like [Arachis ipaensis]|uniref:protein FAR1-RELATED SEQUENCE 5-like n=1 Tax=Arachis ipaensis TaxID=130454 RepID=UPI0007AEED08|nr:protein FAR1-RELATED SEQUENCE 5-like [Arachis ipaensis]XP_025661218.1 protein FAR1-RELATED SEQUENCE 5-like [Arachis hypogaea]
MMHGFAVRLDEVRRDSDGSVIIRQIVCNRAGSRKEEVEKDERIRDHRPLTRSCCRARIRARLDTKIQKWKVVSLYEEHSHELVDPLDVSMMPEFRTFSVSDKDQGKNLHDIGIRTCHILGYLAAQKGGYANLSFNQKDMYNLITQHRKEKVKGGDANAAISYLRGKVGNDSYFFGKYTLSNENRLENLFWANGTSRIDYECFGDVLTFDSTYNRNIYNKPLVIFSGSNHHGQTVIFGCGLLVNEDIGSYKWLLETFLEAMGSKHPTAVVTDGDLSMREAIKQVFPYATHRLCAWHLHRNACEKVKNSGFLNDFKKLIYANVSVVEFQVMWEDMVARTTSQCEGINSLIKAYVRKKDTLEFINNMETVVSHYRNNERVAEFNSKYTDPVLVTSLPTLEDFAAKTFTRNMFREVRKEIEGACAMNTELVIHDSGKLYFKCNIFGVPEIDHVVEFDRVREMLRCECLWFENRGIPCMHIFVCLKHQHVEVIPECLVCKRWTKIAKSDFMKTNVDDPSDSDKVLKCRLGVLGAECSRLMDVACKNSSDFVEAMNVVVNTIRKLQKRGENSRNGNLDDDYIVDPLVVKSKGALKKNSKFKQQRRCSNCGVTGHYNKSCPNLPGRIPKEPVDDDTEKNISSHLDIFTKRKRHDSLKNQQKMEKDRNIGGGIAPTYGR